MGRSLSWLVIESPDADGIAAELDVKRMGKSGAISDFRLSICSLADGRVLVVSNNCDEPLFSGKRLAKLSARGPLVCASMEEHVMSSTCSEWANGRKTWGVSHDSEKDRLHLAVTGKPPHNFAALKQASFDEQAREDANEAAVDHIFDLPLQCARAQTGLDVENDFGLAANSFQKLDVGRLKRYWRATFLLRLLIGFFGALYVAGWIARKLGWQ
jgi:hypothetical protein